MQVVVVIAVLVAAAAAAAAAVVVGGFTPKVNEAQCPGYGCQSGHFLQAHEFLCEDSSRAWYMKR